MTTFTSTALTGQQPPPQYAKPERNTLFTVAWRMFNEGFKKSTILRITGLSEDEFLVMIRELHIGKAMLA